MQAQLSYSAQDLPGASGDTGWFPSDSPAQLRLTGQLAGQTTVAMTLNPTACWDDGMTLTAPGVAQAGLLDAEYGAEFQLLGQVHTSVLGYQIDWEGAIPMPAYVPNDLLLACTTPFDPAALPDSSVPVVSATSAPTSNIILVSTDVISDIIDITGISGGIRVTVQGGLTTSYSTTSISIGNGALTSATGSVTVAQPGDGFGDSLGAPISASGVVVYQPSLIFSVRLYFSILGISVVNWDLASVTLPLPEIDREVTLTGSAAAIPLPRLDP
ncbi:MAG TPA: hypothetical protein VMJ10_28305, partial [Kofleriaceae bacterium]|nr:hypothetical protein [Kofleriaceae bacterium]